LVCWCVSPSTRKQERHWICLCVPPTLAVPYTSVSDHST
jgi:hypothetical protein